MQSRDGVFLEDLCPKLRDRNWRRSLHGMTERRCLYCGRPSESIDHIHPRSRGGASSTENCVPACLGCNGSKGDQDAFSWYRQQQFYDPRRARALRAWVEGDLRLAMKLLQWCPEGEDSGVPRAGRPPAVHQTRQASTPLWRWQMAS
ncbi:MAG: HNH endonuclease signature motif containing protein [Synechococcaceae cyanobacterium]|nr:HNH endonuclease signature motif containing protein [Synechococcaceae cyanobacterium]